TRCLSDWSSDVCSSDLRPAVGVADVANDPRHGPARLPFPPLILRRRDLPGKHAKAGEIGNEQGVRFLDPGEPLERRAVEGHLPRSEERRVGKGCRAEWG